MMSLLRKTLQYILTGLLVALFSTDVTLGQNNVSISQEGKNNRVTVHHGSKKKTSKSPKKVPCNHQKTNNENIIWVQAKTDTSQIFLERSNLQSNSFTGLLATEDSLLAKQRGSQNMITARLEAAAKNKLELSQKGSQNILRINPCRESHSTTKKSTSSHIRVSVQGKDNSVQINN